MHALRITVLSAAMLAACSHAKPAPEPVTVPAPVAEAAPVVTPEVKPAVPAPPEAPKVVEVKPTASIYFAFDQSLLTEESRKVLTDLAASATGPGAIIRIEGNCDERGSVEYNIGLGQRRADAAKNYLVRMGVPASAITAISYGEERPKMLGHDEGAWRENRRDDIFLKIAPAVSAR
ncbi:MAG TPA: OmpA family protein [Myxococcales bacterium]